LLAVLLLLLLGFLEPDMQAGCTTTSRLPLRCCITHHASETGPPDCLLFSSWVSSAGGAADQLCALQSPCSLGLHYQGSYNHDTVV